MLNLFGCWLIFTFDTYKGTKHLLDLIFMDTSGECSVNNSSDAVQLLF